MVKPSGSTTRSKRAPRPADDLATRERILDAAHAVFVRKGSATARTQEIADEAGVNKALLHYYFGTKAGLADAILARAMAELAPRIFGIIADPQRTIEEKVQAVVNAQIDFHTARPYFARYLIAEMHAEPDRVLRAAGRRPPLDELRRQLAAAAEAGTVRPISAEQFVTNMMALCIFPFATRPLLRLALDLDDKGFDALMEERRRELPAFVMGGLRP
jgi:AcrR family transcriptional regulator